MIYVMSDIHGNSQRFNSVMKQINLQAEDTLYVLGDIIDRNPDGIKLLTRLRKMPNVKILIGNHEYMMLQALYYPTRDIQDELERDYEERTHLSLWYRNGGDITHNYLKHIKKTVRQEIFEFLDSLPLSYRFELNGKQYILCHAGLEENFSYSEGGHRYESIKEYCVWTRKGEYFKIPSNSTLIFGHTPTSNIEPDIIPLAVWHGKNRVDIDCGCGYPYPGRLGCLRLDDMKEFYSEVETEEDLMLQKRWSKR